MSTPASPPPPHSAPSRTAPQFVVRLPSEEFRDRIAAAAKANSRSMNAEIVARLQASFEAARSALDVPREDLRDLQRRIYEEEVRQETLQTQLMLLRTQDSMLRERFSALHASADEEKLRALVAELHNIQRESEEIQNRRQESRRLSADLHQARDALHSAEHERAAVNAIIRKNVEPPAPPPAPAPPARKRKP